MTCQESSLKVIVSVLALILLSLPAKAAEYDQAYAMATAGRGDDAVAQLRSLTGDPRAQALLCIVLLTMDRFDDSVRACEAAVRLQPSDGGYQLSLARAYGSKAEHSGVFTGMKLVGTIRRSFEKAVELEPTSVDAISDLGEFYVSAPGIVGGGTEKAQALVDHLMKLSPARGHRLQAMIAQKSGNNAQAESELHKEIAVKHSPESYVDLANYYAHLKQWQKAADAAQTAIGRDTRHGADVVDAARLLVKMNCELSTAQQAYRDYLAGSNQSIGTPAFKVHALLGELLQKQGDRAGARKEFAAALALVKDYAPARRGAQA